MTDENAHAHSSKVDVTGNKAAFCFRSFDQEKKDKTETWFGAYKAFRWRALSTLISWENETKADIAYISHISSEQARSPKPNRLIHITISELMQYQITTILI